MIYFSKNFMVKCMIDNAQDEHVKRLSEKLHQFINRYLPSASCVFVSNKEYWKEPATRVIVHRISDVELYGVLRFIKAIPLQWNFKESTGYEVDLKKSFHMEDAIWSQNVHPEESFLIPEVTWVHIYTWPEDQV